jgi:hypothetical protein
MNLTEKKELSKSAWEMGQVELGPMPPALLEWFKTAARLHQALSEEDKIYYKKMIQLSVDYKKHLTPKDFAEMSAYEIEQISAN